MNICYAVIIIVICACVLCLGCMIWFRKRIKDMPERKEMAETKKMVKKIMLNNESQAIDDILGIVIEGHIQIEFELRKADEG